MPAVARGGPAPIMRAIPGSIRGSHMRSTRVALAFLLCSPVIASAQGTAADYARSEGLRRRIDGLVVGAPEQARWIGATGQFWYRKTTRTGWEYMVVDAK